jgi:hypothetical protein
MHRALLTLSLVLGGACYNYAPLDTSIQQPPAGEMVALDISDRGRVALGERFGPGLARIEGRVRSVSASTWELDVFKVGYLRDEMQRWGGERVSLPSDAVASVQTQSFSRRRTTVAALIAVGTVAVFIATRALFGAGAGRTDPDPGPDPDQSIRGSTYRAPSFPSILPNER